MHMLDLTAIFRLLCDWRVCDLSVNHSVRSKLHRNKGVMRDGISDSLVWKGRDRGEKEEKRGEEMRGAEKRGEGSFVSEAE